MIVHITCTEKDCVWTANVQGLDGVITRDASGQIAVNRCKVLALHGLAELMMNDKINIPWSISFVVDNIIPFPEPIPSEKSKEVI